MAAANENSQDEECKNQHTRRQLLLAKLRNAVVTKPAARPHSPAQTKDPGTTFGTEVWTVQREEWHVLGRRFSQIITDQKR